MPCSTDLKPKLVSIASGTQAFFHTKRNKCDSVPLLVLFGARGCLRTRFSSIFRRIWDEFWYFQLDLELLFYVCRSIFVTLSWPKKLAIDRLTHPQKSFLKLVFRIPLASNLQSLAQPIRSIPFRRAAVSRSVLNSPYPNGVLAWF